MIRSTRTTRRIAAAAATVATVMAVVLPLAASAATSAAPAAAAASPPRCAASDLGVWVAADQADGAAGSLFTPLEFTNLSHHACTLRGFPGVSALGRGGHQLGKAAAWDHGVKVRTIRLAPGATAHTVLRYSDVVVGNCPSARRHPAFELRVFPPGRTRANHALWGFDTCKRSVFLGVQAIQGGIGVRG